MNNKRVTKAVIPCAGMGTRFLPYTKASPKELIPVSAKPVLQYIVEEVKNSGITDICLVINGNKEVIKKHFAKDNGLAEELRRRGHDDYANLVEEIGQLASFTFVYQDSPIGSAHAVYLAKEFVGNDPFALLFGDDLIYSEGVPPTLELIRAYEKTGKSVLGVQEVAPENVSKYGAVSIVKQDGDIYYIDDVIEKPKREEAPSNICALGRYVLSPEVFDYIEKTPKGVGGEYQITDSFRLMTHDDKMVACTYHGRRYDTGNKNSYLEAVVDYALKDREVADKFKEFLKDKVKEF